jgi:hypothetical protein
MMRAGLVALMLAAALAGCGGDGQPGAAPGSAEKPLAAQPQDGAAAPGARSNEARPAPDHGEAAQPGYQDLVDRQRAKPRRRFTPCDLVSSARARAIVGAPLGTPVEAPQGPTCIYRTRDGDGFVTVSVQAQRFQRLRRQLRRAERVDVTGRTGYCGKLGQEVLFVPVAEGRVLSIAAPCRIARRFAAAAVPRLVA